MGLDQLPGNGIQLHDPLDLVAEHLDADHILAAHGDDLDHIPPHPEGAPAEAHIIALILNPHQAAENVVPIPELPVLQGKCHAHIVLGGT